MLCRLPNNRETQIKFPDTPSVGFCKFVMVQEQVSPTKAIPSESPGKFSGKLPILMTNITGATTESSCTEFCISKYRGKDCQVLSDIF